MADDPDSAGTDPEVEALLGFPPVVRKCVRHDGWTPERQREFIRALVVLGGAEQAAIAVGGTMSGAYKLRTAAGGGPFASSWDAALALHFRRNPKPEPRGRPSRGEIQSGAGRRPWPAATAAAAAAPGPEEEARAHEEMLDDLLAKYMLKLAAERQARLAGRIVEADFYVRQLSWFEVVLDLGGRGHELLSRLKQGQVHPGRIVATPVSLLLDDVRRALWRAQGEPDRPPLPELGRHTEEIATGPPLECQRTDPHLSDSEWRRMQAEKQAVAAEAQRLWEEKARAEAAAWAKREEAKGGRAGAGEADEP